MHEILLMIIRRILIGEIVGFDKRMTDFGYQDIVQFENRESVVHDLIAKADFDQALIGVGHLQQIITETKVLSMNEPEVTKLKEQVEIALNTRDEAK